MRGDLLHLDRRAPGQRLEVVGPEVVGHLPGEQVVVGQPDDVLAPDPEQLLVLPVHQQVAAFVVAHVDDRGGVVDDLQEPVGLRLLRGQPALGALPALRSRRSDRPRGEPEHADRRASGIRRLFMMPPQRGPGSLSVASRPATTGASTGRPNTGAPRPRHADRSRDARGVGTVGSGVGSWPTAAGFSAANSGPGTSANIRSGWSRRARVSRTSTGSSIPLVPRRLDTRGESPAPAASRAALRLEQVLLAQHQVHAADSRVRRQQRVPGDQVRMLGTSARSWSRVAVPDRPDADPSLPAA